MNKKFFVLAAVGLLLTVSNTVEAQTDTSRWTTTATDGGGLGLGDATTLTWGIVADGTGIVPQFGGESNDPSSLISFLDTNIGAGAGGADLTNRPWFGLFENIYGRWGEVSGLSFNYEPNDNDAPIGGGFNPGVLGTVADLRIGGHSIDGQTGGNTLAYNFFPNNGDMVIDTDNVAFYSNPANNFVALRNVLAHEVGHGLGLPHLESNNSQNLLEPFINLNFDGPQLDDIHQAQRRYGDQLEENGGNDTTGTATNLGIVTAGTLAVGSDANRTNTQLVLPTDIDFLTIDDDSDVDIFEFTIFENFDITFTLDMVGAQYNRGPEGGTQSAFDLASLSDLDLRILAGDGTTVLGTSNMTGLDLTETIDLFLTAGTYFVELTGRNNAAQFYELTLLASSSPIPEPSSMLVLGLFGGLFLRRRRNVFKA